MLTGSIRALGGYAAPPPPPPPPAPQRETTPAASVKPILDELNAEASTQSALVDFGNEPALPTVEDLAVYSQLTKADLGGKPYTWVKHKAPRRRAGQIMHTLSDEFMAVSPQRPSFRAGDALQVTYKNSVTIARPNVVRGVCIAVRKKGYNTNFKLLCVIDGVKVEFMFPLYCPMIDDIRVLYPQFINKFRKNKFRKAKAYHLRDEPMRTYTVTLLNTGHGDEVKTLKTAKINRKKGDRSKAKKKAKKQAAIAAAK